jgi:hypothetical protein
VLGYTYPLLSIFWSLLMFAAVVILIFVIIYALIDNFSRRDHSGWAKADWCVLIVFLPFLRNIDLLRHPCCRG